MKKLTLLSLFLLVLNLTSQAQDKPFRVGVKLGIPQVVSLNLEYVTPILNNRLAVTGDYGAFSIDVDDVDVTYSYFEIGANYYFRNEGKGPYGHISYGNVNFDGSYTDPTLGTGDGTLNIGLLNLKIGAKWGGTFYFRPEIGYAILVGDNEIDITYTDPFTNQQTQQTEDVPGVLAGGFVANIGIGLAF